MDIKELFKGTDIKIDNNFNLDIKGITLNSKEVKKGYLFIAVKGERTNGIKFIDEAIKNGAKAILSEEKIKAKIPTFYTSNILNSISKISSNFYQNPSKNLIVTGITGTKGKTTISYLIEGILKHSEKRTAVIGTINYRTYKRIISQAQNTTPLAPELNKILSLFLRDKVTHCIMEVSSHSLALKRVEDIEFDNVIFTNFQSDHIDFHKNRENYFKAKLHLFELLIKSPKKNKFAILNADDEKFNEISKILKGKILIKSFSIKNDSDFRAENIKITTSNSEFDVKIDNKKYHFISNLVGMHNIYNILASIAYSYMLNLPIEKVVEAISKISTIPGRLEKIVSKKGFTVYIDYAHTAESLENVLMTIKNLPHKRIITVFGCGGNRDKTKRSPMGKIACSLSDYVIITSDNPRNEDPEKIIQDIEKGIINKYKNYEKITDRKKAIFRAIQMAKQGDIILIAGKGHETYQIIGDKKFKFDDKQVVKKALKE